MSASASSTFMWPGMRPRRGEFQISRPRQLGKAIEKFADFVLRLRYSHAVSRDDDDFVSGAKIAAASSAVALRTGLASAVPATAACSCPNAPNRTFENERFIAFDIFMERMNPMLRQVRPRRSAICC